MNAIISFIELHPLLTGFAVALFSALVGLIIKLLLPGGKAKTSNKQKHSGNGDNVVGKKVVNITYQSSIISSKEEAQIRGDVFLYNGENYYADLENSYYKIVGENKEIIKKFLRVCGPIFVKNEGMIKDYKQKGSLKDLKDSKIVKIGNDYYIELIDNGLFYIPSMSQVNIFKKYIKGEVFIPKPEDILKYVYIR